MALGQARHVQDHQNLSRRKDGIVVGVGFENQWQGENRKQPKAIALTFAGLVETRDQAKFPPRFHM